MQVYGLNSARALSVLVLILSLCSIGSGQSRKIAVSKPKMYRYLTANGSAITLTELGQIIGFGTAKECVPAREPCIVRTFAFLDQDPATGKRRILYDVLDKRSAVLGNNGDLVPVHYDGPPSGTRIQPGKDVHAHVTLKSRDDVSVIDLDYKISEHAVTIGFVGRTNQKTSDKQCGGKPCNMLLARLYCEPQSCNPDLSIGDDPVEYTIGGQGATRVLRPSIASNLAAAANQPQNVIVTGSSISLNAPAGVPGN